ncbi:MAG: restriction endonuclease subunit S [Desulfobulbaceae bacterium]|nr:restriction endonuclease subunit S [Desulfobulbaceae bacterium]
MNNSDFFGICLPPGWEFKTLDDLTIRLGSGITPTGGSEVYKGEGIIFIRSQNVTNNGLNLSDVVYIDNKIHQSMTRSEVLPFDVLLNITGASIGRCCFMPEGLGTANQNQHVCTIRLTNANLYDAKILTSILSSPIGQQQIFRLNAGGNREGLNYQQLRTFQVPWPTSLERSKIARILTTIDSFIMKTEGVIAKLRQVKTGMLHDLLTCGLDENGEIRDPIRHPEHFKNSPLGRIPKEWEIKGLSEVAPIVEGQVDPTVYPFADFILVAPDHIESGTGRLLNSQTARQQAAISGKYRFLPGDVVYSKIRPYLRKVWLATFEGICSADMYPFRPGIEIDSQFLLMTLLSERFSRFATSVSERSGFPKINRTELSFFRFALPFKKEQERIAQVAQAFENKLLAEQVCKVKLISLKHGLMHDLLTGTVRVPANLLEATP